MDSVPLEMDDIFAEHEDEDDDIPAPLPDLPQELEPLNMSTDEVNPSQDTENAEVLAKLKDLSKGAARNVVRRPVPKLDCARLTGNRGIPILPQVFKDITFKGKGHEAEDLKMFMGKLEHWAHRLFPKMPFDEVLERIEKLGSKKEVQTCIKKMRLDMPLLDEDFVMGNEENDVTEPADTGDINTNILGSDNELDIDAEEAFDKMMHASGEQTNQIQSSPHSPGHTPSVVSPSNSPEHTPSVVSPPITPGHTSSAATSSTTPTITGTTVTPSGSTFRNGLTPDQLERIERNRRHAMEKRNARLQTATEAAKSTQPTASQQSDAGSSQNENKSDDTISAGSISVSNLSSSQEGPSQPAVSGQRSGVEDQKSKQSDDSVATGINSISNSSSSQEDTSTNTASTVLDVSNNLNYQGEDADSILQVTSAEENQQVTMSAVNEEQSAAISTLSDNHSEKQVTGDEEQMNHSDPENQMKVSVDDQQDQISDVLTSDVMFESTSQDASQVTDNPVNTTITDGVQSK